MNRMHIPYNGVVLINTTAQEAKGYASITDLFANHSFEIDLPALANIVFARYQEFSHDPHSLDLLRMAAERATAEAMARTLTTGKKP